MKFITLVSSAAAVRFIADPEHDFEKSNLAQNTWDNSDMTEQQRITNFAQ